VRTSFLVRAIGLSSVKSVMQMYCHSRTQAS
jgi:hypothetical protein